jgi:hypothetical protein
VPVAKTVNVAVVPALLLATASVFNQRIVGAEAQHPEDSLFLFDLVGISHQTGANLVPGPWTPAQARQIPDCYGVDKWDHVGMGHCRFLTQTLDDSDLWGGPALSHAWLGAIAQHAKEFGEYPPINGNKSWRDAAAAWLVRRFALPATAIDAEKNLLPLNGTREGLFLGAVESDQAADAPRQIGQRCR